MNSVANHPFTGEGLQAHLVQIVYPWFIRRDTDSVERILMEETVSIKANSFIEYYY